MFKRERIPKDNYPDEYESRAFQHYRDSFRPGVLLLLRTWSSHLLFAALVFLFAALGLSVAWIALPPQDPQIIVVTPAFAPSPVGDVGGDFPADVPQTFILTPAKIDHEIFIGQRHGYRFFLQSGISWTFTVTPNETFDPMMSLYGPDGVLVSLSDDVQTGVDLRSQFTFTPPTDGQYALLIESTPDQQTAGGYTLQIMPNR